MKFGQVTKNELDNLTYGANGMPAYASSLNANLDLFASQGALRGRKDEFLSYFAKAFQEEPVLAIKNLFLLRDIRGGMGERQLSRDALTYLEKQGKIDLLAKILPYIPVYGRWDDLYVFTDKRLISQAVDMTIIGLTHNDTKELVAKWLPIRKKNTVAEKKFLSVLRSKMKVSPKELRQIVVSIKNVIETDLCKNEVSNIELEKVPSLAMVRYRNCLKAKHSGFEQYVESLTKGETKVNAGALYPYDLLNRRSVLNTEQHSLINAQWKALPQLMSKQINVLPIIDVSGSMECYAGNSKVECIDIAVSLGIYLAEQNKGDLHNITCSFSDKPRLFSLGNKKTATEKYKAVIKDNNVGYSTDVEKTIKAIIKFGIDNQIKDEDMPKVLLFLSDMNFNEAQNSSDRFTSKKAMKLIKDEFEKNGYTMPNVVYWNLNHNGSFTTKSEAKGFSMASGFSPKILNSFADLLEGSITPTKIMLETLAKYPTIQ